MLTQAGLEFETVSPRLSERFRVDLTLRELTTWNALRKGISIARKFPESVVLAADTLVAIDDHILGKPCDAGEAVAMLERLAGRAHEVCTSVFICQLAQARSASFHDISHVYFRRLNRDQISNYLARVNPLDKAGAYAAQGLGGEIIEKIDGSYTNVVGLPMEKTVPALAEFGIVAKTRET